MSPHRAHRGRRSGGRSRGARAAALALLVGATACVATSPRFPLEGTAQPGAEDAGQAPAAAAAGEDVGDLRARADAAAARQDWDAAARHLDAWAAAHPGAVDADYLQRRAVIAERQGDVLRTIALRRRLLEKRPDDAWLRVDLADDLQRVGRDAEAVAVLEVYREDREEQRLLWHALVELHERAGRFTEAAMNAERIAAMEPPWEDARRWWYRASGLWERAGDYARATETVGRALGDAPLRAEEQKAMARLRAFQLGEPQNVADAVALLRYHEDPGQRLVGARYLRRGRFPEEVRVFEEALEDPDPRVVTCCLWGLRERAPRGRFAAVLPLLEHDEERVRLAALSALGALGTEEVVPALLDRLQPQDRAQFRAARKALEQVTGHGIGISLDPDREQREDLREQWLQWWGDGGNRGGGALDR